MVVLLSTTRNDPSSPSIFLLSLRVHASVICGVIPRARAVVVTGEDQSATNAMRYARALGNPKADATSWTTQRAAYTSGVDKKAAAYSEASARHACTTLEMWGEGEGESIDGFGWNTRRLSSRVSAHGCRLNLRPRPRKKTTKETMPRREGSTLIFIRRSLYNDRASAKCRLYYIASSPPIRATRT